MTQQSNEMAAGVTQLILKEWSDGLAHASPLWDGVVKGDGREKETGGTYLQAAIKLIPNAAQGFIAGSGANVSITPSVQNQYMVLNWKFAYWGTNFTLSDMTIANGEEDKIKILAKKLKGSINDSNRLFASATHVGSGTYPLYFEGLADVGAASGTAYAGLTDTDYTDDTTAYLPYISTATQPTYATISDMINAIKSRVQVSEFNPSRIFGLMNSGTFSKFQQSVQASQMFIDSKDMYSVGMSGFRVNGVEFYLDYYAAGSNTAASADNYIWIIPQDVFKFHYKFGFDNPSPFDVKDLRIPDQPVLTTQNYIAGNWFCTDRRLVAVCKTATI
jgi:hypothetical protein